MQQHTSENQGGTAADGAVQWVKASGGNVPPGAIAAGHDCSGEELYVARAEHEGAMLPGKLVPSHRCAYVAWGGEEHAKPNYEVLVGGSNRWVSVNDSNVPSNAVPGGQSEDGEILYIGRVHHEDSITPGKVQKSHSVCYIPFGGEELGISEYEVLIS